MKLLIGLLIIGLVLFLGGAAAYRLFQDHQVVAIVIFVGIIALFVLDHIGRKRTNNPQKEKEQQKTIYKYDARNSTKLEKILHFITDTLSMERVAIIGFAFLMPAYAISGDAATAAIVGIFSAVVFPLIVAVAESLQKKLYSQKENDLQK